MLRREMLVGGAHTEKLFIYAFWQYIAYEQRSFHCVQIPVEEFNTDNTTSIYQYPYISFYTSYSPSGNFVDFSYDTDDFPIEYAPKISALGSDGGMMSRGSDKYKMWWDKSNSVRFDSDYVHEEILHNQHSIRDIYVRDTDGYITSRALPSRWGVLDNLTAANAAFFMEAA